LTAINAPENGNFFSDPILSTIRGVPMFSNILVAVDGSEHAKQAVHSAAGLAAALGGRLTIVHVMRHMGGNETPQALEHYGQIEHVFINEAQILEQIARTLLNEAETIATTRGAKEIETLIRTGDAAKQIIDICKERKIELVVLGRRGLGDIASLLLGSVSHKVIQLAPCACLTIPVTAP
jgi:nucleotide-binding universal stress UspA family protein